MTRERLQLFSFDELCNIAKQSDIGYSPKSQKEHLIDFIVERCRQNKAERVSLLNYAMQLEARKFSVSMDDEIDLFFDDYHEFPDRYNKDTLVILLRDPSWAYLFWDLSNDHLENIRKDEGFSAFFIRVIELSNNEYDSENIMDYFDIPVDFDDLEQYINLPEEDAWYCCELRVRLESGESLLLRSNIITNSRNTPSPEIKSDKRMTALYSVSGFSNGFHEFPEDPDLQTIPQRIIPLKDIEE